MGNRELVRNYSNKERRKLVEDAKDRKAGPHKLTNTVPRTKVRQVLKNVRNYDESMEAEEFFEEDINE